MSDVLDTTMNRAMSDAERASIEAAQAAYLRSEINQREIIEGSGVYVLVRGE